MRYVLYFFGAIFGLFVIAIIGLGINFLFFPVHVASKGLETATGIVDKTLNADNAISNYEWFKQTSEDITSLKAKVAYAQTAVDNFEQLSGPRTSWTFEDKTEWSRLNSVKQGLQSQLQDVVATYNARAKMANRKIFLEGKIPAVMEVGAAFLR